MDIISVAREKYRPKHTHTIFIAEAPPCTEGQFFYFEEVAKGDALFLHIIRAVFPDLEKTETKIIRRHKKQLLERFQAAGYLLEDSVNEVIPKGTKPKDKERIIQNHQSSLIKRLLPYKENAALILLGAQVFKSNYQTLKDEGFTLLNDFMIPFPGSGQQGKFKEGIAHLPIQSKNHYKF